MAIKEQITTPIEEKGNVYNVKSSVTGEQGKDYNIQQTDAGWTSSELKQPQVFKQKADLVDYINVQNKVGDPGMVGGMYKPQQPLSTYGQVDQKTEEASRAVAKPKLQPVKGKKAQPIVAPFDDKQLDEIAISQQAQEVVNTEGYNMYKTVLDIGAKTTDRETSIVNSQQTLANFLATQQATFNAEVASTKKGFEDMINSTDIETQELLKDSQEDLNTMYDEMVDIGARLDKMNTDELEIYNDVVKEVAGKASQSYINAVVAKRKKELYPEKYALQRDYNKAAQKYQYYDTALKQQKAEIKQEKQDRYNVMTDELNFLQLQQTTKFSQTQQVGELYIEGEEANQSLAKQKADQQKWLVDTAISVAKLPKGFSIQVGDNTFTGLEENDNYSLQTYEDGLNKYLIAVNKNDPTDNMRMFLGTGEDNIAKVLKEYEGKKTIDKMYDGDKLDFTALNFKRNLGKDFQNETFVEGYKTLDSNYKKMDTLLKQAFSKNLDNATKEEIAESKSIADQGLIMLFQKMLDHDSVVREGEFDRVMNGQGFTDRIKGFIENLTKGGSFITDDTRREMVVVAKKLRDAAEEDYIPVQKKYQSQGVEANIDPSFFTLGDETMIEQQFDESGYFYSNKEKENIKMDLPNFQRADNLKLNNPAGLKVTPKKEKLFSDYGINFTSGGGVGDTTGGEYFIFETLDDALSAQGVNWLYNMGEMPLYNGLLNWKGVSKTNKELSQIAADNYATDIMRTAFGGAYQSYATKTFSQLNKNEREAFVLAQFKRENNKAFTSYVNSN